MGQKETTLVLGRHSGKHALYDRLKTLGYKSIDRKSKDELDLLYQRFKELAVTKKEVSDGELAEIAEQVLKKK